MYGILICGFRLFVVLQTPVFQGFQGHNFTDMCCTLQMVPSDLTNQLVMHLDAYQHCSLHSLQLLVLMISIDIPSYLY